MVLGVGVIANQAGTGAVASGYKVTGRKVISRASTIPLATSKASSSRKLASRAPVGVVVSSATAPAQKKTSQPSSGSADAWAQGSMSSTKPRVLVAGAPTVSTRIFDAAAGTRPTGWAFTRSSCPATRIDNTGKLVTMSTGNSERLDYSLSGTLLGLYMEPQSQNWFGYTEDFTSTSRTTYQVAGSWCCNGHVAVSTTTDVDPRGGTATGRVYFDSGSITGIFSQCPDLSGDKQTQPCCISMFARKDSTVSAGSQAKSVRFTDLVYANPPTYSSNGRSAAVTLTTGWSRVSVNFATPLVTTTGNSSMATGIANSDAPGTIDGNTLSYVDMFGPQLEFGRTTPTSYIYNSSSTVPVTRNPESASFTSNAGVLTFTYDDASTQQFNHPGGTYTLAPSQLNRSRIMYIDYDPPPVAPSSRIFDATTGTRPPGWSFTRANASSNYASYVNSQGIIVNQPTANAERLNYSMTSVGTILGLLYEPAATNQTKYSGSNLGSTGWTVATQITRTANDGVSPASSGSKDCASFLCNTGGNNVTGPKYANSSNATCTVSVWIKHVSGSADLMLYFDSVPNGFRITPTTTWTRYSFTTTDVQPYLIVKFVSAGTKVLLWGAQIEVNGFATSYVDSVSGTSFARLAESASFTLDSAAQGIVFTFDDGSKQTITGLTGGQTYTIPTNLNRPNIKFIDLQVPEVYSMDCAATAATSAVGTGKKGGVAAPTINLTAGKVSSSKKIISASPAAGQVASSYQETGGRIVGGPQTGSVSTSFDRQTSKTINRARVINLTTALIGYSSKSIDQTIVREISSSVVTLSKKVIIAIQSDRLSDARGMAISNDGRLYQGKAYHFATSGGTQSTKTGYGGANRSLATSSSPATSNAVKGKDGTGAAKTTASSKQVRESRPQECVGYTFAQGSATYVSGYIEEVAGALSSSADSSSNKQSDQAPKRSAVATQGPTTSTADRAGSGTGAAASSGTGQGKRVSTSDGSGDVSSFGASVQGPIGVIYNGAGGSVSDGYGGGAKGAIARNITRSAATGRGPTMGKKGVSNGRGTGIAATNGLGYGNRVRMQSIASNILIFHAQVAEKIGRCHDERFYVADGYGDGEKTSEAPPEVNDDGARLVGRISPSPKALVGSLD